MKGEILFEKMTGISDEYVMEAALVAPVIVEPVQKKRTAPRPAPWRRGLSAACIVLVAVVALLLGTAGVGRIATPAPEGTPPLARFGFTYELGGFDGTAMPGDTVCVDTTIINRGLPFVYHGSSASYHPDAHFVLQGNESVSMQCAFMETCDSGPHAVAMGEEGGGYGEITIPADAIPGVYDLVLSYKGTVQVYKGVLTVGEIDTEGEVDTEGETYPPAEEGHAFSFGFKTPNMQSKLPKDFPIDVHVTNEGEPFTYEGDPADFSPDSAILYHMESGYEIKGYGTESGRPPKPCNVYFGQKGVKNYTFPIPADAPEGVYGIKLTYGRASESLPNVLIVNDGKVGTYVDRFTFGYELAGDAAPGTFYHMNTWVVNEGASFTFEGSSMGFAPSAVLIHMETQYRIEGNFDTTTDFTTVTVKTGDKGQTTQEFMIPTDAPTGAYALQLSYDGVSKSFAGVVIVAEPTVEMPTVLSNLTVAVGEDWLYEPIDEAYVPGELVTVRIQFATDVGTLFFLNGEVISPSAGDDQMGYWEYSFYMPQKDSEIIFRTYDGTAPYSSMLEACIRANPYLFDEKEFYYYGEFGDGVMVGLQLGRGEAIRSTAVGGYTFVTPNTHDMMAFHNGTLYELQTAYDMGLLTDEHLEAMLATHKEWFPYD